jgi:hypothetical protein
MKRHLDEGVIQAYLDGELPAESASAAASDSAHAAQRARCDAAATDETAAFAAAFAADEGIAVPSEALRARIGAAVARLEPAAEPARGRGINFGSLLATLGGLFSLTPQRGAAFASLLAVAAFAVIFALVQKQNVTRPSSDPDPGRSIAGADVTPTPMPDGAPPEVAAVVNRDGQPSGPTEGNDGEENNSRASVVNASAPKARKVRGRPAAVRPSAPRPAGERLLPGEKNYQEAIASLTKAVELGGDRVMTPKTRFEYERNIALLDRAISETRRAALRDPKDTNSVSFLMAAYQSKVDLLTTVADQAQVAALGR